MFVSLNVTVHQLKHNLPAQTCLTCFLMWTQKKIYIYIYIYIYIIFFYFLFLSVQICVCYIETCVLFFAKSVL